MGHAPAIGIHDHLAHTPGRSLHRVALFGLYQSQAYCLRNLDNSSIVHYSVLSLRPSHQGIMSMNPHPFTLHCREKGIEHSLAPITHFEGYDFGSRQSSCYCVIHLPARKATLIRVACYDNLPISTSHHIFVDTIDRLSSCHVIPGRTV